MQNNVVELAISTYNDIYLNTNIANKVIEKYYDELMTDFNAELRNILLNIRGFYIQKQTRLMNGYPSQQKKLKR